MIKSAFSEEYLTLLDHNLLSSLTKCVQQILQKRQTQGKLKHCLLNGGRKMSVGVVYVYVVYMHKKNIRVSSEPCLC